MRCSPGDSLRSNVISWWWLMGIISTYKSRQRSTVYKIQSTMFRMGFSELNANKHMTIDFKFIKSTDSERTLKIDNTPWVAPPGWISVKWFRSKDLKWFTKNNLIKCRRKVLNKTYVLHLYSLYGRPSYDPSVNIEFHSDSSPSFRFSISFHIHSLFPHLLYPCITIRATQFLPLTLSLLKCRILDNMTFYASNLFPVFRNYYENQPLCRKLCYAQLGFYKFV